MSKVGIYESQRVKIGLAVVGGRWVVAAKILLGRN